MSADGSQPIGKITKQWPGPSKEVHTDADNFGIQCEFQFVVMASELDLCYFPAHDHIQNGCVGRGKV